MTEKRPKLSHIAGDIVMALVVLPPLAVGVAAHSFNFDDISLLAWLFGADARVLWSYFWYYAIAVFLSVILFAVMVARRSK